MTNRTKGIPSTVQNIFSSELLPTKHGDMGSGIHRLSSKPDMLVRWEQGWEAESLQASYTDNLLCELRDTWHIPNAHVGFIITDDPSSLNFSDTGIQKKEVVVSITKEIPNVLSKDQTFEQIYDHPEVAAEYDSLSSRLLDKWHDLKDNGGLFDYEYWRYDQFVFDPSADEDQRLILVDTQPTGLYYVPPLADRPVGHDGADLFELLFFMTDDVIKLEEITQQKSNVRPKLMAAIRGLNTGANRLLVDARDVLMDSLIEVDREKLRAHYLGDIEETEWEVGYHEFSFAIHVSNLIKRHRLHRKLSQEVLAQLQMDQSPSAEDREALMKAQNATMVDPYELFDV